jgi:L-fuculose-phosphate aldolase
MKFLDRYAPQVAQFVRVCGRLSELMYVTGHGGNLAWKLEEDLILITPTQMNKGDITPADVVFLRPDGTVAEGVRRPTGETPMYVNFFRDRPDINAVIHCHPPMTGAFAITAGANLLMRPVFPETTTEVGPVPVVPYGEPLTQRLADNFLPFLGRYNAFLMENHGLVIMTPKDIAWAMMLTELLEMTSVSLLQAMAVGAVKEISRDDVANLDNIIKARNLPMFGAPGVNRSLVDLYFEE